MKKICTIEFKNKKYLHIQKSVRNTIKTDSKRNTYVPRHNTYKTEAKEIRSKIQKKEQQQQYYRVRTTHSHEQKTMQSQNKYIRTAYIIRKQ